MKISFSNHKRLYKEVFGTDMGKKVLHDLASKYHMVGPTIRPGENSEQYLVREGMRQVILYILHQVDYDIDKYLRERQEYKMEIEHDE